MPEVEEPTDRLLASYTGTATPRHFILAPSALMPTEMKGWAAEQFGLDTPPEGATKLRFTRVDAQFRAYSLANADPTVAIHAATTDATPKPGAIIGSAANVSRVGLSTSAYTIVSTELPAGIETTDFAALFYVMLKGTDLMTPSAYVQYQLSGIAGGPHMEWSTNGGSTWQPATNKDAKDLWFKVYGRYTTP